MKNAPEALVPEELGRQPTLHTSLPVSVIVETAVRADRSQTLIVLSADLQKYQIDNLGSGMPQTHPERANLPSGEICVLRTQDECPVREATAPEPGLPDGDTRTSCRIRRLSSDPDNRSWIECGQRGVRWRESSLLYYRRVWGPGKSPNCHGMGRISCCQLLCYRIENANMACFQPHCYPLAIRALFKNENTRLGFSKTRYTGMLDPHRYNIIRT